MKRAGLFLCIVVAALSAAILIEGCSKKKGPADAKASAATQRSDSTEAQAADPQGGNPAPREASNIEAFGIVKAKKIKSITLDFPALVEKKVVSEGQRVKAGNVLFRFSSADYDATLRSKGFELSSAKFELKKTELEMEKLQEDLRVAQSDVEKAAKDVAAKEKLYSTGGASQEQIEEERKKLQSAQQEESRVGRSLAECSGGELNSLEMQRARIALLEGELRQLEEKSSRSYISGNAVVCDVTDGIVSDIGYAAGDSVSKDRKMCSLMDLDSIVVEANVPEEFIKDVHLGSAAEVVPTADNARSYGGSVVRISSLAVKVNGETVIPVEISLKKRDGFLMPNYNVDVTIH